MLLDMSSAKDIAPLIATSCKQQILKISLLRTISYSNLSVVSLTTANATAEYVLMILTFMNLTSKMVVSMSMLIRDKKIRN